MLNLKRPLVFFDLETTGLNITKDRIIEISYIKVFPNGEEVSKTIRVNPEIPIPAEATAVHHISNEDVAGLRTFKEIAKSIVEVFQGCDIAGFNSTKFDIPMLDEEFNRAEIDFEISRGHFIDVQTIFHKKEPRNLVAAYKFYCNKDLENAHSAYDDTLATYEVFKAQLERYDDLKNDVEWLAEYGNQNKNVDLAGRLIYDGQGREIINFGKYKGQIAEDVLRKDPGYYGWIEQSDFSGNTKRAFKRILMRVKAEALKSNIKFK